MASPKIVVFTVYNSSSGAPLSGQAGSITFTSYTDDLGSSLSQPSITEIGTTGSYKFTPTFTTNRGINAIINTGSGANPQYYSLYLRPEDYNIDNLDAAVTTRASATALTAVADQITTLQADVTILKTIETGKWTVVTSGPDANRLVLYDVDGTTPLYKFNLTDQSGVPTTSNPYTRTPV